MYQAENDKTVKGIYCQGKRQVMADHIQRGKSRMTIRRCMQQEETGISGTDSAHIAPMPCYSNHSRSTRKGAKVTQTQGRELTMAIYLPIAYSGNDDQFKALQSTDNLKP